MIPNLDESDAAKRVASAVHLSKLHSAVAKGKTSIVHVLCSLYPGLVRRRDEFGRAALHHVVGPERFKAPSLADVNASDLASSPRGNSSAIVQLLCKKGADVNQLDNFGQTALHHAAAVGFPAISALIDAGANLEARDRSGRTALHRAVDMGQLESVRVLLERKADVNALDLASETPFSSAARVGDSDILDLLYQNGADVNRPDSFRLTALHHAAGGGFQAILLALINMGANLESCDRLGRTPLRFAVDKGKTECSRVLLEHNAEVNTPDLQLGMPLHSAACRGECDMVNLLCKKGADINRPDNFGLTALHHAAAVGFPVVILALIHAGAHLEARDRLGRTALHLAVDTGQLASARVLLDWKADVNATNLSKLEMPLHCAADRGDSKMVDLLCKKGAYVNGQDNAGLTALRHAVARGFTDTASILIKMGAKIEFANGPYPVDPVSRFTLANLKTGAKDSESEAAQSIFRFSPQTSTYVDDLSKNPSARISYNPSLAPIHTKYLSNNRSSKVTRTDPEPQDHAGELVPDEPAGISINKPRLQTHAINSSMDGTVSMTDRLGYLAGDEASFRITNNSRGRRLADNAVGCKAIDSRVFTALPGPGRSLRSDHGDGLPVSGVRPTVDASDQSAQQNHCLPRGTVWKAFWTGDAAERIPPRSSPSPTRGLVPNSLSKGICRD